MGQEPGCLIHLQLPVQPPAVDVITQPKHSCYFSAMKFYIAVGQTSGLTERRYKTFWDEHALF